MCICMHMLWCMYEASGFQYLQNWRSRGPKLSRIQKIMNCAISNFWAFREPQIPRIHGYPKLRSFRRNNVDSAVEGLEHFFGYALFWILLSFGYILDTVWIRYGYAHFGYILDTFWIHYGYILDTYNFGYALDTMFSLPWSHIASNHNKNRTGVPTGSIFAEVG